MFDHWTGLEKVMTVSLYGNKVTTCFVHKPVHVRNAVIPCFLFLVQIWERGRQGWWVRPHAFLNISQFVTAHTPVFDQSCLMHLKMTMKAWVQYNPLLTRNIERLKHIQLCTAEQNLKQHRSLIRLKFLWRSTLQKCTWNAHFKSPLYYVSILPYAAPFLTSY